MQQKSQSRFDPKPDSGPDQEGHKQKNRKEYFDSLPGLILARLAERYFLYSDFQFQIYKLKDELRLNAKTKEIDPEKARADFEKMVLGLREFLVEIIIEMKLDENHVGQGDLKPISNFMALLLVDKISRGEFEDEHLILYYMEDNRGNVLAFENAALRLLANFEKPDISEPADPWLEEVMREVENLSIQYKMPGQVVAYLIKKYGNPVAGDGTDLASEEALQIGATATRLVPFVAETSPLITDRSSDLGVTRAETRFVAEVNLRLLREGEIGNSNKIYDLGSIEKNPYGLRVERVMKFIFGDFNFKDLVAIVPSVLFERQIRKEVEVMDISDEEIITLIEQRLAEKNTFQFSNAEINLFEFPRKPRLSGEDQVVSVFADSEKERIEAYENLEGFFQVVLFGNLELCRLILLEYFGIPKTKSQIRVEDCRKVAAEMLLLTKKFLVNESKGHNEINEALKLRNLIPEAKIYVLLSYLIRYIITKPHNNIKKIVELENGLRGKYFSARKYYLDSLDFNNFLKVKGSDFNPEHLLLRRGNKLRTAAIRKMLMTYINFHMMTRPLVLNTSFGFSRTPELNGINLNNYIDQGMERVQAVIDLYIESYERFGVSVLGKMFTSKQNPIEIANLILRDFVDVFVIADARDIIINSKN